MARRWRPHRMQLGFLIAVFIAVATMFHSLEYLNSRRFSSFIEQSLGNDERDPEVSCVFPIPDPLNPEVMEYYRKLKPLHCSSYMPLMTKMSDNGTLLLNTEAGATDSIMLPCYYSEIQRPRTDDHVNYGPYHKLHNTAQPETDFVYVECNNILGFPLYQDFFAYARKKPSIREFQSENELSVAMIGLDSMSRMNFIRQMPLSYKYITEDLGAVTLLGYNKVGVNTFPNVMPMLTGKSPPDIAGNFDSVRFIWNEFAEAGAVTTYAEDWPNTGTFQVGGGSGFVDQPTHHYMHTFYRALQNSFKEKLDLPHCLGARSIHSHHFAYLLSILRVYRNSPSFLFSLHNGMSHDYFNLPQLIDADLRDFLRTAHDAGYLNRTVLILYGDHGQRIEAVRNTEGGRIEDLMPLMSFILPRNVNPTWKKALIANTKRLASNYDVYSTLADILGTLLGPSDAKVSKLKKDALGMSLFSEIRKNRSCDEAHIEDRFCSCAGEDQMSLSPTSSVCLDTAETWIRRINERFIDTEICSLLYLRDVIRCRRTSKAGVNTTYRVTFSSSPGDAVFESTSHWGDELTSLGDISRINRYDTDSYCVRAVDEYYKKMREFCYCK